MYWRLSRVLGHCPHKGLDIFSGVIQLWLAYIQTRDELAPQMPLLFDATVPGFVNPGDATRHVAQRTAVSKSF